MYTFTRVSKNRKTGPIPTVMSARSTCPPSCPLYDHGCYALGGAVRIHWNRVEARGTDIAGLAQEIRNLPRGQTWRFNVAGDLPGAQEYVSHDALAQIVRANKERRGFTYTHKNPHLPGVAREVQWANRNGFTINLSSNNVAQADDYLDLGVAPVVTLIPKGYGPVVPTVDGPVHYWQRTTTPKGRLVIQCPAEYTDKIQCSNCGGSKGPLCQRVNRDYVVGFTAHGIGTRATSAVAQKGLRVLQ